MQETIYVGLDLGSSFCCQSVIDVDGSHRFSRFVPTSERHLRDAFSGLEGEVRVHMEAGELAGRQTAVASAARQRRCRLVKGRFQKKVRGGPQVQRR